MKNSLNYNMAIFFGRIAKRIERIGVWFFNRAVDNWSKEKKDGDNGS